MREVTHRKTECWSPKNVAHNDIQAFASVFGARGTLFRRGEGSALSKFLSQECVIEIAYLSSQCTHTPTFFFEYVRTKWRTSCNCAGCTHSAGQKDGDPLLVVGFYQTVPPLPPRKICLLSTPLPCGLSYTTLISASRFLEPSMTTSRFRKLSGALKLIAHIRTQYGISPINRRLMLCVMT